MQPIAELVSVRPGSSMADVERICLRSGRSRVAVIDHNGRPVGIVHVRDAVRTTTLGRQASAADLMTDLLRLPAATPLLDAVASMREHRVQIAVVSSDEEPVGFLSFEDLVEEIIGDFDDETDFAAAQALRRRT